MTVWVCGVHLSAYTRQGPPEVNLRQDRRTQPPRTGRPRPHRSTAPANPARSTRRVALTQADAVNASRHPPAARSAHHNPPPPPEAPLRIRTCRRPCSKASLVILRVSWTVSARREAERHGEPGGRRGRDDATAGQAFRADGRCGGRGALLLSGGSTGRSAGSGAVMLVCAPAGTTNHPPSRATAGWSTKAPNTSRPVCLPPRP
jgi:hypothetical protein